MLQVYKNIPVLHYFSCSDRLCHSAEKAEVSGLENWQAECHMEVGFQGMKQTYDLQRKDEILFEMKIRVFKMINVVLLKALLLQLISQPICNQLFKLMFIFLCQCRILMPAVLVMHIAVFQAYCCAGSW